MPLMYTEASLIMHYRCGGGERRRSTATLRFSACSAASLILNLMMLHARLLVRKGLILSEAERPGDISSETERWSPLRCRVSSSPLNRTH